MQTNQQQVVLDSLPYIDQVHPDYEAYAMSLIEEEMKIMKAPENIVESSVPKFKNDSLNQLEYQQLVQRNGEPRSDAVDYVNIHKVNKNIHSIKDKKNAISSLKIQLEHERIRQINLELENEFSSSIWKHHVRLLEASTKEMETKLQHQLEQVDEINAKTKPKESYVSNNFDLEYVPKEFAMNKISVLGEIARGAKNV